MGITNKMERMFLWLPYLMVAVAIALFVATTAAHIQTHFSENQYLVARGATYNLAIGVAFALLKPLILIALAALVHRSRNITSWGDS